jgi:hypothetical protein
MDKYIILVNSTRYFKSDGWVRPVLCDDPADAKPLSKAAAHTIAHKLQRYSLRACVIPAPAVIHA